MLVVWYSNARGRDHVYGWSRDLKLCMGGARQETGRREADADRRAP